MFASETICRFEKELIRQVRRIYLQQHRGRATASTLKTNATNDLGVVEPTSEHMKNAMAFSEIPGPKSLPFLGTMWMSFPGGPLSGMSFYDKLVKMRETYGDIIREEVAPGFSMVHLFNPDDYAAVYRKDGKYPRRDSFFMLQKYLNKYNNQVHGLITSQGEKWHRLRRQVQQKMLKPQAVTAYFNDQEQVAEDFISCLRHHRNDEQIVKDMLQYMYRFATESIGVVCFNKRIGALDLYTRNEEADRFIQAVSDTFDATHSEVKGMYMFRYFDTPTFKRLVRAMDFIREVSSRHAEESLQRVLAARNGDSDIDGEHGDLIPYLMSKTDLTDAEVMTMVSEFFFGGVDTTSHMLAFILYNLSNNNHVTRKLQEEIDRMLPDGGRPTSEIVSHMSYLKAVIKESLRVLPVAPGNGRTTSRDLILSGYHVPGGTFIAFHHDVTGHEDVNFPDAKQFKPERWLRSEESKTSQHPFILMPFGFGPRQCIGRRFAEQEVSVALIKILQNFDIEYCHHEKLRTEMCIINAPVTPLHFRLTDRK